MNKSVVVVVCVLVLAGFAMAQSYTPTQDVLGAHQNYGRGCAGCHQPHSGAGGAGGNALAGSTIAVDKSNSGNDALFGQDLGPLYGLTMAMGDNGRFVETLPLANQFAVGEAEIRGIMMCLACHDGAVAKGAMMQGNSYEQRMGLLPAGAYGNAPIPTLLGADGWGVAATNQYNNDHPVGIGATLGAASLIRNSTDASKLVVTFANGEVSSITPAVGSQYENFVKDYGMPSIAGTSWEWGVANPTGNTDPSKLFITCTTCHNQHVMNVYKSNTKASGGGLANSLSGTYKTYFFINGPYNVDQFNNGSSFTNRAASATQFCRQCHFSVANEAFGLNLPTQF